VTGRDGTGRDKTGHERRGEKRRGEEGRGEEGRGEERRGEEKRGEERRGEERRGEERRGEEKRREVFTVDLDLGARPLAEQDAIASLDVQRDQLAAVIARAGADGHNLALLGLFLGSVGDDDTTLRLLFAFKALDDDAVVQGTELHVSSSFGWRGRAIRPPRHSMERIVC
jgi:hypothetical protein